MPGVNKVRRRLANGETVTYFYHRATGQRLDGQPGTVEFQRSWAQAEARLHSPITPARATPPFEELARSFRLSPEYRRLAEKTRRQWDIMLQEMTARFGWVRWDDLNRRAIRAEFFDWRDEMADTPRKADVYIASLCRLLNWAMDRGRIEANHAARIPNLVGAGHNRAGKIITPQHESALRQVCNDDLWEAYQLALYTALRRGDLMALRWPMLRDGWLSVTPSKTAHSTSVKVHLPVFALPPLQDLLAGLSRCTDHILTTRNAHPWAAENLNRQWQQAKRAAAETKEGRDLDWDIHWHDIRGTGLSRLWQAGCTDAEVAMISGHSIGGRSMLRSYAARDRELAVNAYRKLWSWMSKAEGDKVVALRFA